MGLGGLLWGGGRSAVPVFECHLMLSVSFRTQVAMISYLRRQIIVLAAVSGQPVVAANQNSRCLRPIRAADGYVQSEQPTVTSNQSSRWLRPIRAADGYVQSDRRRQADGYV